MFIKKREGVKLINFCAAVLIFKSFKMQKVCFGCHLCGPLDNPYLFMAN